MHDTSNIHVFTEAFKIENEQKYDKLPIQKGK